MQQPEYLQMQQTLLQVLQWTCMHCKTTVIAGYMTSPDMLQLRYSLWPWTLRHMLTHKSQGLFIGCGACSIASTIMG